MKKKNQKLITKRQKSYPLKDLLAEFKEEYGQSEKITLRHLEECKKIGLLNFNNEYVYGRVDILK